jgi:hypothetical protein
MKLLLALFLLFAGASSCAAQGERVYVGKVVQVSRSSLELDQVVSIGFVGDAGALGGLKKIKRGNEVRAVFVATTLPGATTSINKLLSIRRCTRNDPVCRADRASAERENEIQTKHTAATYQEHLGCLASMQPLLLNDVRFDQTRVSGANEDDLFSDKFNALKGTQKMCADQHVQHHQEAIGDACERQHCGDKIAGGCSHITRLISPGVIRGAVLSCSPL